MNLLYRALLYLSFLCLGSIFVLMTLGYGAGIIGILTISMLAFLAIGVRGTDSIFKSFSFSIWVFTSVTAAMFYPGYFLEIGGFSMNNLIVPLIQIIMFGMGISLSIQDFKGVVKMPKGVLIGIACQYTLMPLLGISLALIFSFPAEIAAGVVLVGSAPGGVASNVMAYIAGANLALSITLTTIATLLSPILTPLLMQLLAGQFIPIDFWAMMLSILNMIILPVVLGVLFNRLFHGKVKWLDNSMPVISMTGIVVILGIMTAGGRDSLLAIGLFLVLAGVIHNIMGYLLGYWGGRLFGMDERSCRTISLEVGMQNAGMVSGIAIEMGKMATVGVASVIFGSWMNVSGSTLANWWRRKEVEEKKSPVSEKNVSEKGSDIRPSVNTTR